MISYHDARTTIHKMKTNINATSNSDEEKEEDQCSEVPLNTIFNESLPNIKNTQNAQL